MTVSVGRNIDWFSHNGKQTVWRLLKKRTVWYSNSTSGSLPEGIKSLSRKDIVSSCSMQHYLQQPRQSTVQWQMNKENVAHRCVYVCIGILFSHKEILPFATSWMDTESIVLSEINQRKTNNILSIQQHTKNECTQ